MPHGQQEGGMVNFTAILPVVADLEILDISISKQTQSSTNTNNNNLAIIVPDLI
jgi:hypothetical protein